MKKIFLTLISWQLAWAAFAQNPAPAPKQQKPILLQNATVHIGNGKVLDKAFLMFDKGKITFVDTKAPTQSENVELIDVQGKHIYPGFILPSSIVGLTEIDAVRATRDFAEVGKYNPHIRAMIAYNTDADMLATIRYNGVLMVQTTPRGGVISGTSSVMQLDAWNWEDALVRADDGVHLNWIPSYTYDWKEGKIKKNDKQKAEVQELEKFFTEALYYTQNEPKEKNLKFEALKALFDGTKTLYLHTDEARDIVESVQFAQNQKVKKIVVVGASQSYKVIDFLKQNNISILLNRVHSLPTRNDEDIDMPYKLAAILYKAGILVGLTYEGDMEAMGARNLPFTAGTAAAYGLSKEEALSLITANTANILGIQERVGTLEVGKDATLFVSEGDALDMKGNNLLYAFIEGRKIQLSSKQTELYKRYQQKYLNKQ
ncbi:MAG: amidohydrolase family protein [Thermonemataceae bacterium]|nr:amidohydrolase family protein [Thermonemataceae bacterium]